MEIFPGTAERPVPMFEYAMIKPAATKLIDRFGDEAFREAEIRAAELLVAGDREGHELWIEIRDAVGRLLGEGPQGQIH